MKPKEYIKKYNLIAGWKRSYQDNFLADLTSELFAFLEMLNAFDNPQKFDNALNMIRNKWDAISNKIPYGLPEGMWRYYYATTVLKIRKETCPTETNRIEREREERRLEYEERKRRQAEEDAYFQRIREERQKAWEKMRDAYFFMLFSGFKLPPLNEFRILGLTKDATADEVRSAYRELTIKYHPDRGGDQEKFVQITEAKNKCLAWINRN